jgi:hypothetical protein
VDLITNVLVMSLPENPEGCQALILVLGRNPRQWGPGHSSYAIAAWIGVSAQNNQHANHK